MSRSIARVALADVQDKIGDVRVSVGVVDFCGRRACGCLLVLAICLTAIVGSGSRWGFEQFVLARLFDLDSVRDPNMRGSHSTPPLT